jgi:iron complex transport system permease protein
MKKFTGKSYLINLLVLVFALGLSVAVGSVSIPVGDIFGLFGKIISRQPFSNTFQTYATIVFQLRLPRTVLMAIVGAALAGSGASYQGLFRNPLADPYLIGVASGAGLGAVIAMSIKFPYGLLGLMAVPLAAFLGAVVTVFAVYALARVGKTLPTTNLILAGVAASAFTNAIASFMLVQASGDLRRALVWLLGGSSLSGWQPVLASLPYILAGLGTLITMGHALNVLQFGDDQAHQLGLRVNRIRVLVILSASLATAAAISVAGIIGFVGLIVPHVIRLIWGGDYRHLIPASMIGGASLLLLSDVAARVVLAPQELPVGIITALVGAPFFFWVLSRAKRQNFW